MTRGENALEIRHSEEMASPLQGAQLVLDRLNILLVSNCQGNDIVQLSLLGCYQIPASLQAPAEITFSQKFYLEKICTRVVKGQDNNICLDPSASSRNACPKGQSSNSQRVPTPRDGK